MRRKMAAGNWKMHGTTAALREIETLARAHANPTVDILICPPSPLIHRAAQTATGTAIAIGGQDCHAAVTGAHTGDVSAMMLADAGAGHVIVGHSERRADHHEEDADIRAKARTAMAEGLVTIICVGESLAEREADNTLDIISGQLAGSIPDEISASNTVLAYEPIWAIGTGLTPTTDQIAQVHRHMRDRLTRRFGSDTAQGIRLLYGGSVKASNAADIFAVADVDGALVGGASLRAEDFSPIITALEQS